MAPPSRSALIVVDFQEDFCPPVSCLCLDTQNWADIQKHGSLAVQGGRDIAPVVNSLTKLPFKLKVATQDWHPQDHVSFASNHPPPDNKPFTSTIKITNPLDPDQVETTNLWPDHCIQGTKGAELVPEFDTSRIDIVVKKGQDRRVEMFSAFHDTYSTHVVESELKEALQQSNVDQVFVVGLATDFCVMHTAFDAAKHGFETFVVVDACRAVNGDAGAEESVYAPFKAKGVQLVQSAQVADLLGE